MWGQKRSLNPALPVGPSPCSVLCLLVPSKPCMLFLVLEVSFLLRSSSLRPQPSTLSPPESPPRGNTHSSVPLLGAVITINSEGFAHT